MECVAAFADFMTAARFVKLLAIAMASSKDDQCSCCANPSYFTASKERFFIRFY
jgi:hypothetical protein